MSLLTQLRRNLIVACWLAVLSANGCTTLHGLNVVDSTGSDPARAAAESELTDVMEAFARAKESLVHSPPVPEPPVDTHGDLYPTPDVKRWLAVGAAITGGSGLLIVGGSALVGLGPVIGPTLAMMGVIGGVMGVGFGLPLAYLAMSGFGELPGDAGRASTADEKPSARA